MRIAILGAGRVGTALGRGWASHGHEVVFGVRDPADPRHAAHGSVATPADAVQGVDVVVLALPWAAVEDVLRGLDLDGVVVVDSTNPLGAIDSGSGAERVAGWAPAARVVKAFNTTGWENMASPAFAEGRAAMFVAADDTEAKETVRALARELGFDAVDAGPLAAARELEALASLWIRLSRSEHGRGIAFSLLHRTT